MTAFRMSVWRVVRSRGDQPWRVKRAQKTHWTWLNGSELKWLTNLNVQTWWQIVSHYYTNLMWSNQDLFYWSCMSHSLNAPPPPSNKTKKKNQPHKWSFISLLEYKFGRCRRQKGHKAQQKYFPFCQETIIKTIWIWCMLARGRWDDCVGLELWQQ